MIDYQIDLQILRLFSVMSEILDKYKTYRCHEFPIDNSNSYSYVDLSQICVVKNEHFLIYLLL